MSRALAKRMPAEPKGVLRDDAIYIGDNGRVHCGALKCAGMSAHFTGIALDGGPVVLVDASVLKDFLAQGLGHPQCEACGASVVEVRR